MMKKRLLVFSCILLFHLSLTAQEIPNPSFESWSGGDPVDWLTSDLPGLDGILQSSDAQDGNFSAYLEVLDNSGAPFNPLLRVSGSDSMDGIPVTQRYTTFSGYYKFTRMGIDFLRIQIFMHKNNVQIGTGGVPKGPDSNWAYFNQDIT